MSFNTLLKSIICLSMLFGFTLLPTQTLMAQASQAEKKEDVKQASPDEPDIKFASPQATILTFLSALQPDKLDYETAIACLDFSKTSIIPASGTAKVVAQRLKTIMDRVQKIDPDAFPTTVDQPTYTYQLKRADKAYSFPLVFIKQDNNEWKIGGATVDVDQIDAAHSEVLNWNVADDSIKSINNIGDRIQSMMPKSLQKGGFILQWWQWIGLFGFILLGMILNRIVGYILSTTIGRILKRADIVLEHKQSDQVAKPLGLVALALTVYFSIHLLNLPVQALQFLLLIATFFATFSIVWSAYRAVDVMAAYLAKKAEATDSKMDDLLVPLLRKSLKIFVTLVGALFILDNLEVDITSFLLSLGIGGLAFALAAKDSVENLFGSLTVILDKPFQIGDWIVINGLEGTVEEVGFRSTRIRTFYNSLITVPNGNLVKANIDNYGARFKRRIKVYISITYDTPPEKIEAFVEGIRELNVRHPYTKNDYFHVYFNQFAASSLDILLYAFVEVPDWATELRERERLFLDIIRLAKKLGIEFAYPTQSLHIESHATQEPRVKAEYEVDKITNVDEAKRFGAKEAAALAALQFARPPETREPVKFNYDPENPNDKGGSAGDSE